MKKILTLLALLGVVYSAYPQEVVKKNKRIDNVFSEEYDVLKENKKIRHGQYKLWSKQLLIALGSYKEGKRCGIWDYYNSTGKVIQQYDYDQNLLVKDESKFQLISYDIPGVQDTDTVLLPVKIGGSRAGYFKLLRHFSNARYRTSNGEKIFLSHRFQLDEQGNLVAWTSYIENNGAKSMLQSNDIGQLTDDEKAFVPAQVNGKLVPSSIIFTISMQFTPATISIRRF